MNSDKTANPADALFGILRGALLASILSVALLLLLAVALEKMWLPLESAEYISPALKVIGAALAAMVAIKKCARKRWLVGMGAGIAFSLIAFMTFSIISNTFHVTVSILMDMGICAAAGGVTGIIIGFKR